MLREEGVSFQAVRTWKRSNDPNFEPKKNRILELYYLADAGQATVICLDEFGPLNIQPQPSGKAWVPLKKPRRIRATYKRPHGVRGDAVCGACDAVDSTVVEADVRYPSYSALTLDGVRVWCARRGG